MFRAPSSFIQPSFVNAGGLFLVFFWSNAENSLAGHFDAAMAAKNELQQWARIYFL
jgi:hypothetical protein